MTTAERSRIEDEIGALVRDAREAVRVIPNLSASSYTASLAAAMNDACRAVTLLARAVCLREMLEELDGRS